MSKKYESVVSDYCVVVEAIESYVSSQVADFEYWDAEVTKFFIDTESATYMYDYVEAAKILGVSDVQMQNFLIVHCCLGDYLDGLIGEKDPEAWDMKGQQLVVTYSDNSEDVFQTSDICELMRKTEAAGWTFADLVSAEKALQEQAKNEH
ncbi:hypothetical protein [Photobacterium phosphoreum]|jgi:hypothetical protein|uniref:Uncharacterized protein n=1 Tax=Photobacterium phosphoreum TaxID=659 RepID=A0A2T3PPD1_PHOPO|nr:hypothetical protein [Photobacterium phosphoreum]KJF87264.1 hypothetical protein UB41_07370 [Photobacterium phosphoreum]MCD9464247.1 hypothetical protein [Photobacterium phosphoreum]MCD9471716.1 hypothetical protein [Photobacterium phosphoreum]MCD9479158.1 hypothetical protein [Photobacterium phosphoreum]MCD9483260.1 hypothetical protein [Photobacterium phosphoreum]